MSEFALKHRVEGGGTRELSDWGMNSEYGVLREVLLGPIENYRWLETSSPSGTGLAFSAAANNPPRSQVRPRDCQTAARRDGGLLPRRRRDGA